MIDAVIYGMMPRAKMRQPADIAAGEQIEEAEDADPTGGQKILPALSVDAGRRDCAAQTVHGQQGEREQEPLAQIGDAEDVRERFKYFPWCPSLSCARLLLTRRRR